MKQGFKVMDSDIHVQEPHDLWARYIEPQFKERAPQFANIPDGSSPGVWRFEGKVFPAYIDRRNGSAWPKYDGRRHTIVMRSLDARLALKKSTAAKTRRRCCTPWTWKASTSRSCFAHAPPM